MAHNFAQPSMTETTLTRSDLEEQIAAAREEVDMAGQDLERAEDHLDELEEKLKAFPPDGADEELFYARRDPRQMHFGGWASCSTAQRG